MANKNKLAAKNLSSVNAVISLLVLLLAFSTFLLFRSYEDSIVSSGNLSGFIILVTLGFALLFFLLFLINSKK